MKDSAPSPALSRRKNHRSREVLSCWLSAQPANLFDIRRIRRGSTAQRAIETTKRAATHWIRGRALHPSRRRNSLDPLQAFRHLGQKMTPLPSQSLQKNRLRTLSCPFRESDRWAVGARAGPGQSLGGRDFILSGSRFGLLLATAARHLAQDCCAGFRTSAEPISQGTAAKTLTCQGGESEPQ